MIHIKTNEEVAIMRKSCQLAAEVLLMIEPYIKVGVTTNYLNDICHEYILSKGAIPSPLNYKGFPKSICSSINDEICHGIPSDRKIRNGDILNLDITCYLNGFHGDTNKTFFVGSPRKKANKLPKNKGIGNKILLSESDDLAQLIQKDILSTPEFKMAILKEAVSGRGKFTQKEAVADSILKWSVESPSRANYHILDDDYYNKLMGETKFGIRSRGNQRGLAARVDRVGKQKIEEQLLAESDYHFLHETVESLCEGLFTDLLQKAKGMGTRAWNKAQEIYKAVKMIKIYQQEEKEKKRKEGGD